MSFHSKIEKARGRRAQVFMSGLLSTPVGGMKVTIRDVSKAGAHVVGEHSVPGNCRVQLQRGEMHVFAQVAWTRGKEAGLSFERELSAIEIDRFLPKAVLRALDFTDD